MKKIAFLAVISLSLAPAFALAHGHTSFEINEKVYSFVVGSLNEPVAVDDKTGVDLRVESMSHSVHEAGGDDHAGTPVTGLEKTLKVELIAGGKKKILDIAPAYGAPGSYRAYFIPTVQTTYGYRLFGTIDGVPFDYTFTCNPAGHPQVSEDKTEVEVSPGVMRIEAAGAFGCPVVKADLGFPEPSADVVGMNMAIAKAEKYAGKAKMIGGAGVLLGLIGVGLAGFALSKTKKVV